jgi:hypothetical protein
VEARDQGQLDDILQLHRQSHEKERDEGTKPRVLHFQFQLKKHYRTNTTAKSFPVTPSYPHMSFQKFFIEISNVMHV